MIIGITTDWHLKDSCPSNRIDDYYNVQFNKLEQIVEIFNKSKCDYIIHGGDVFDSHRVSFKLLIDTINFFQKHKLKIYGVIGNHCVQGYNLATINNSALGVLMRLGFYRDVNELHEELDIKGIHTRLNYNKGDYVGAKIVCCHDMIITTKDSPFDHIYWKDLDGYGPEVIISGHYHHPFIIYGDKTIFINPGAIMRMSISDDFSTGVDILDTDTYNVKRIEFETETYEKVFKKKDRDKKEILQISNVELKKIDKSNILEKIKKYSIDNGYDNDIVENVLIRVNKAREEIG